MEGPKSFVHPHDHLTELLSAHVGQIGYRVIYAEVLTSRQKTLRLFIEHLNETSTIGIEDCSTVSKFLDPYLDELPEVAALFNGVYNLEVSSPGLFRPLGSERDFQRFQGSQIRVHTFRPLTAEELENLEYQKKNSKQKNFVGKLTDTQAGKLKVTIQPQPSKKRKAELEDIQISIPLNLISKANLEPDLSFSESDERE